MPQRAAEPGVPPLDAATLREQFPVLQRTVRDGHRLVYLDSGATTQRPLSVWNAENEFVLGCYAPVHRGAYQLAEEATDAYEHAREVIASFIGAHTDDVCFTSGATAALNEAAYMLGDPRAGKWAVTSADTVVVTELEHHANLVPWQELCQRTGATLKWWRATPDGRIDFDSLELDPSVKVVAVTHQSNVTGAETDVAEVVRRARAVDACVVLDACQSVPHRAIDVEKLGVDFAAFSGHKMCGPTGVGVLWIRRELRDLMPPVYFGGSMVETVTMDRTTFTCPPQRFEAGTQMVSQVVGLGAACEFLSEIGMDRIERHEKLLVDQALRALQEIPGLMIVGPTTAENRGPAVSFTVNGIHPHDLGQALDDKGVAIRVGHHCAWPIHRSFGVQASARASFYLYNTPSDVDALVEAISDAQRFFCR